jgi:ribosomal protein S18 acetylase RimI-like enzyme
VLDNPIWNGLNSGNKHLGEGNDSVKFFPIEISTFAGLRNFSSDTFMELYEKMPSQFVRATFTPHEMSVPGPLLLTGGLQIHQMVHHIPADRSPDVPDRDPFIRPLTKQHIPEMLALTKLTNPGPFNTRTIEFGNFHGIFSNNKLVAMAGQRLKVYEYTEVSAVCTHPNHMGKGYARRLLMHQITMIRGLSDTPILHVKTDNAAAVGLYNSVGFTVRRDLNVIIFKKP